MMDGFLTLRKMLENLKEKIDEDYAERIEKSSNPKMWDRYEAQDVEMCDKVDSIIRYAEQYLPELIDAELIREIIISTK